MRRLFVGLVVAAATVLAPIGALAGNQEVAEKIAANLRDSRQLHGFKIGVKYQDGTAWLQGKVASQDQMNTALKVVFQTPGVTRVVNNMAVAETAAPTAASTAASQPEPVLSDGSAALTQSLSNLQQATGAVAPERQSRIASETTSAQSHQTAQRIQAAATSPFLPAAAHPTGTSAAERVPTTFAQSGVQPVAATAAQVPTLVAPRQEPAKPRGLITRLFESVDGVAEEPQKLAKPTPAVNPQSNNPIPVAYTQPAEAAVAVPGVPTPAVPMPGMAIDGSVDGGVVGAMPMQGAPLPMYGAPVPGAAMPPACYDQPHLPAYAWPGYAAYPNYAGVTYPKQYSPSAWPYIGPFYPYPQVPLGWRKVCLEWHDGWWFLDFDDGASKGCFSGLFRHKN